MTAKVSFRITTFYKRPRSEPGRTRADSHRVDAGRALGWVLSEFPDGSYDMQFEGDPHGEPTKTTIVIDWTKVPAEIQDGLS